MPLLNLRGIDLVILGGESGLGARPMLEPWVTAIRGQCQKGRRLLFQAMGRPLQKAHRPPPPSPHMGRGAHPATHHHSTPAKPPHPRVPAFPRPVVRTPWSPLATYPFHPPAPTFHPSRLTPRPRCLSGRRTRRLTSVGDRVRSGCSETSHPCVYACSVRSLPEAPVWCP
jgi:hypothetical protein